ncbi:MAG TPA: hypothetical protein GX695_06635 [Acholeplasmataceae bacterium]|nr:hypothetical protein [Acholeplasmataceae bacterium]
MKKLLILFLMTSIFLFINNIDAKASHYTNFESITMTKGKMLSEFTSQEKKSYEKKVTPRKFMGWRTHTVNNRIKISYISETLFSYYNDGYTAIDYNYKLEETITQKFSFSATGSIGLKKDKSGTGFKDGLDTSLKVNASFDQTKQSKETYEIKLKIDPGTRVDLYTYGEGRITNGYAARYVFWLRGNLGGFEYFEVTTSYQRLEKVKI